MSKRTNESKKIIGLLIVSIFLLISGVLGRKYISNNTVNNFINNVTNIAENIETNESTNIISATKVDNNAKNLVGDTIKIYYFDVGQADSILLTSNGQSMLIDAGTNEAGSTVVNDIKALGITNLNYVVGTHPHEDHIGGLDDVINSFDIGTIYMPKIQTNTKTFEDVLNSIANKKLKVTAPSVGETFKVGSINCEVMQSGVGTTEEQQSNLNLSSIVIRATYKKQSYLFMGDATTENEKARTWPQTNVLKVGHHGSNTSSSQEFLNQVKPQLAIISVGKDNTYGLPKDTTIKKLTNLGTTIYRTDEKGTITITSDGTTNLITTSK